MTQGRYLEVTQEWGTLPLPFSLLSNPLLLAPLLAGTSSALTTWTLVGCLQAPYNGHSAPRRQGPGVPLCATHSGEQHCRQSRLPLRKFMGPGGGTARIWAFQ